MSGKAIKRIKTWRERCEEHPDHQERIISERMIQERMQEEIDELRQALETEQEPVAWISDSPTKGNGKQLHWTKSEAWRWSSSITPLYTAPPKSEWVGLTEREVELIDAMIETQLLHAERCDHMANSTMAQKQKAWDLERVELLRKLKERNT